MIASAGLVCAPSCISRGRMRMPHNGGVRMRFAVTSTSIRLDVAGLAAEVLLHRYRNPVPRPDVVQQEVAEWMESFAANRVGNNDSAPIDRCAGRSRRERADMAF